MATFLFRLFVAGETARAERAIRNLDALCRQRLRGDADYEVVDILKHPDAAEEHRVLSTPTLDKALPTPVRRVIGDFSDSETLVQALGIYLDERPSSEEAP